MPINSSLWWSSISAMSWKTQSRGPASRAGTEALTGPSAPSRAGPAHVEKAVGPTRGCLPCPLWLPRARAHPRSVRSELVARRGVPARVSAPRLSCSPPRRRRTWLHAPGRGPFPARGRQGLTAPLASFRFSANLRILGRVDRFPLDSSLSRLGGFHGGLGSISYASSIPAFPLTHTQQHRLKELWEEKHLTRAAQPQAGTGAGPVTCAGPD